MGRSCFGGPLLLEYNKKQNLERNQESMAEMFTIYDDRLNPVGRAPREQAHAQGLLHEVVHCWVVSESQEGVWLYFQQRAHDKKEFPGYYDLTVGGHVDAGEDRLAAVLREMREEIGLLPEAEELCYVGMIREDLRIGDFHDREIGQVYLYCREAPPFAPGEEVERIIKVELSEYCKKELQGAQSITAYTLDGSPLTIRQEEWCRHPGEFARMILPLLTYGNSQEIRV